MKDKLIETLKELAKNPKGKSKTVAVKDLSSTDLKNLFGIFEHLVGNKKYTVSISFPATDIAEMIEKLNILTMQDLLNNTVQAHTVKLSAKKIKI